MRKRPGPGAAAVRDAAGPPLRVSPRDSAPTWARTAETVVFFACTVYLFVVAWLVLAAYGLTFTFGYTPAVITSESMGPSIRTGDVVLSREVGDEEINRGMVVTFARPGYPDQLLTHRVVAADEGLLRTKGDANSALDSAVISTQEVVGVGAVLVPVIAYPVVWARSAAVLPLALWSVVTLIAIDFVIVGPLRVRHRHRNLQLDRIDRFGRYPGPLTVGFIAGIAARIHPKTRSRRWIRRVRGEESPERRPPAPQILGVSILIVGSIAVAAIGATQSAAAFVDPTPNGSNQFSALEWDLVGTIEGGWEHTCAARLEGTAFCWGLNNFGQLGDDTTTNRSTPVQVVGPGGIGLLTDVAAISAGVYHSCVLSDDTTVWCWGANNFGQLGDNTITNRTAPVQVVGPGGTGFMTGVVQVTAGWDYTCAVKDDATLWCWGRNDFGQLGDNSLTPTATPVQVVGPGGIGTLSNIAFAGTGLVHTCAADTAGAAWCWGYNAGGQLGDNSTVNRSAPVQVLGAGGVGNLTGVVSIDGGLQHTCAARSDLTAWCWGANGIGQLGDGTTTGSLTPVQVVGTGGSGTLTNVAAIALAFEHSCARQTDSAVRCWGRNDLGQLGDGTTTSSSAPVQVVGPGGSGTLGNINVISSTIGAHTCGARSDRTVWCWGRNAFGELGDGTTTDSTSPVEAVL